MTERDRFEIGEARGAPRSTSYRVPARWRVQIRSDTRVEIRFRCALAIDDRLQLIETDTPHDLEFSASKFTAFFEADSNGTLSVSGYSNAQGAFRMTTGFSGSRSGKLIFDPYGDEGHILCGSGTSI